MPAIIKKPSKLRLEFVANTDSSVYGGLPAIEALCQQFGLWEKLRAIPSLDPRVRKGRGFGPEVIVAQLLYSFCSGGASLSDSEDLNKEPLARLLANVPFLADQTTVGEWLRAQSLDSIAGMWQVTQGFVRWVMAHAEAGRWTCCRRLELFFDDTQLEVSGRKFEGAKMNYNGDMALSWQTFWAGPFLFEAELGSPGDVSSALPGMLQRRRLLWEQTPGDFMADSGSSAAHYLEAISQAGLAQWSVSYNRWPKVLERIAQEQPETVWGPAQAAIWRDGSPITEQHCFIRHQPEGAKEPLHFAVVRFKKADEFWWNCRFAACQGHRSGGGLCPAQTQRGKRTVAQGSPARAGPAPSALRRTQRQPDVLRHRCPGLQLTGRCQTVAFARRLPGLAGQDALPQNHADAGAAGQARPRDDGAHHGSGGAAGVVGANHEPALAATARWPSLRITQSPNPPRILQKHGSIAHWNSRFVPTLTATTQIGFV